MYRSCFALKVQNPKLHLQSDFMGTVGKILVDEHYPTAVDEPIFDKIESIRSNVKFEQCYERSKLIGDGKFGKVYQVRERATGAEFAAKVIRLKQQADRAEVEREVSILTQLRHPRIAQIYDAFYTANNEVVLVMEIVRGGELFDRVADENYVLTEQAVVMIICQLCEAIDYIHEQNILHLDIKPENIMCVSQTGNRIKLIDFGLARYYDGTQELRYMAGTPEFAAPEVIKYEQLDYSTDMWSVGVITYILLSGYSPFLGENVCETYCNVEKGEWEFTEEFDSVSEEAKDFVSRLIVYEKKKRMLPKECLAHPWIAKHRAKANLDTLLEKPAEGPAMDKKQMMRYNAKRKFRFFYAYMRLITYVKIFIELNRLRRIANCRMSRSGQQYFEKLLLAAETEKLLAQQNIAKASTNQVNLQKLPGKGVEVKKETNAEASTSKETIEEQEKKPSTKRAGVPLSEEKKKADNAAKEKEDVPVEKKAKKIEVAPAVPESAPPAQTVPSETPKQKRCWKKSDQNEKLAAKPPQPVAQAGFKITAPGENAAEKSKSDMKSLPAKKIPEVVITVPSEKVVRKETPAPEAPPIPAPRAAKTAVSAKNLPSKAEAKLQESPLKKSASTDKVLLLSEKVEKLERRSLQEKKPSSLERVPNAAKTTEALKIAEKFGGAKTREKSAERSTKEVARPGNLPTLPVSEKLLNNKEAPLKTLSAKNSSDPSVEKAGKKPVEQPTSLRSRKSSAPEAIITEPPKKTVLGSPQTLSSGENRTTPMRMQRFGSSESGDSTKENQRIEEKKPTRQGAMRKKEKPTEKLFIDSMLPSPEKTFLGPTVLQKRASAGDVKPLLAKANVETSSTPIKPVESTNDAKVTKKRGSLVQEKLSKLGANTPKEVLPATTKPALTEATEKKSVTVGQETKEQKKAKFLPITIESKTTTTTSTSTSTTTRKASIEKRVQHISTGKKVEEVERKFVEQDNATTRTITSKKAETCKEPPVTVVKQDVLKENSLRSTTEKERVEEQKKDTAKILKTARSALVKAVDKVTIEESSKVDGKTTKFSVAGTKDVSRKVKELAQESIGSQGKTKTSELTATEKVKVILEVGNNDGKCSLEKTTVQKVVVSPMEPASKSDSKPGVSLRSRSASPGVKKLLSRTTKELKEIPLGEEAKKKQEGRPPAPDKNTTKTIPEPEKVPVTLHKATSVKMRENKPDRDLATLKKKRATIASSSVQDTQQEFVPREDFSFDALKDKLIRRVSKDNEKPPPKKECISITSVSSVRDRLKQFENKK
ncbi:unnamed protein product [Cylicocyclus nassatus]|uniref:Protein kinase domain-containing protein n=1 Tax=Cylicocyclus nassatus TaxID=53992 RepID=A0AA36HEF5_CYLNA|nr:unnamed protein product [Cylicocyclus nassatus]